MISIKIWEKGMRPRPVLCLDTEPVLIRHPVYFWIGAFTGMTITGIYTSSRCPYKLPRYNCQSNI